MREMGKKKEKEGLIWKWCEEKGEEHERDGETRRNKEHWSKLKRDRCNVDTSVKMRLWIKIRAFRWPACACEHACPCLRVFSRCEAIACRDKRKPSSLSCWKWCYYFWITLGAIVGKASPVSILCSFFLTLGYGSNMLSLQDKGPNSPGIRSGLWPLLDVWPQVSHLALSLLIEKLRMAVTALQDCFEAVQKVSGTRSILVGDIAAHFLPFSTSFFYFFFFLFVNPLSPLCIPSACQWRRRWLNYLVFFFFFNVKNKINKASCWS